MKIENRELYLNFWDETQQVGVYALLIGWAGDSLVRPVVAYNYGLHEVLGGFEVWTEMNLARREAANMRGPRG